MYYKCLRVAIVLVEVDGSIYVNSVIESFNNLFLAPLLFSLFSEQKLLSLKKGDFAFF